ncbi:AgmX/PglI C-terminal domain-containing protein [Pendulispora albinea]|uniref:AgmX/PglI C-terminal domain-containing protein n=1 Tax=Pendulispora albinea TaxID=2741071 RepID=A0ABZ2LQF6_9BACT
MSIRTLAGLVAVVSCASSVACGGAQQEARSPDAEAETTSQRVRPQSSGMQVSTELGSIDSRAVEQTFWRLQSKLQGCYKNGLKRVEYLEGDIKVFLRVGQDGTVRYGYFEDSTLGDRESEKCMMDVLTSASWPKPQGGEAEVRNSFGFDAPGDVRAPVAWNADRVNESLGKNAEGIRKCKEGVSGRFRATAYVEPDGRGGKVQAASVVPPSKEGADKVDCLVDAIRGLSLPSPGSYAAKVSFDL